MASVLVTGCLGRVGARVVAACARRGRRVAGVDVARGLFEAGRPGDRFPPDGYMQADLSDAGATFAAVLKFRPDVIVHCAAVPDMTHNPAHEVFSSNTMSTFNVIEACLGLGVRRLVNISSLQVLGIVKAPEERGLLPRFAYIPIDEEHPVTPQNPYALSKLVGEQLCDAAARRAPDFSAVSLRPTWCVDETNIERNLGALVTDSQQQSETVWSYVCLPDVADAVLKAAEAEGIGGHEVLYLAASDTEGGRDLAEAVRLRCGAGVPLRTERLSRADASGIDCSKADRLLGWRPRLSWRDYLDEQGRLRAPPPGGWY